MEDKTVMRCHICGNVVEDKKKFFKKTQECRKCYDKRWLRERNEKIAAGKIDKPSPKANPVLPKPQPVKAAHTNGTDEIITKIEDEIELLQNQKEVIEYKLSVLQEVRGMLD